MTYYIYKHTNKVNGKVYIGQTCRTPTARWGNGKGYVTSPHMHAAIQKYGWENFTHEILYEVSTVEEANKLEIELIKQYKANDPAFGYNLQDGGKNGLQSDETKAKIRAKQLGSNNSFYGHKHSEETKKRISEANTGGKHARAKRVKCVETQQEFVTLTEAAIWCSGDSNFRGKISEACRGKRQSAGKHPITGEKLHWQYVKEN